MKLTLENPLVLVEIFSGVIGILLSLHFLTDRNKTNRYLGGFLFFMALETLTQLFNGCACSQFPKIPAFFPGGFPFLNILLLYLYVRNLTGAKKSSLYDYRYYFIPGGLHIVFSIWLLLQSPTFVQEFLAPEVYKVYGLTLNFSLYVFNFYFLILSWKLVYKHQKTIHEVFSELRYKKLLWLWGLIILLFTSNTVWVVEDLVMLPFSNNGSIDYYSLYGVSIVLTFITTMWVGRKGLQQSEIFDESSFTVKGFSEDELLILPSSVHNTDNQVELTVQEEGIYLDLVALMEKEKLYQELELTLLQLADRLQVKDHMLTKIIKSKTNNNFHSFINRYRVDEFKRLLDTEARKQLNIRGIAYKAGFKSKSTFYAAFKKFEGTTPSAYLQKKQASKYAMVRGKVVVNSKMA